MQNRRDFLRTIGGAILCTGLLQSCKHTRSNSPTTTRVPRRTQNETRLLIASFPNPGSYAPGQCLREPLGQSISSSITEGFKNTETETYLTPVFYHSRLERTMQIKNDLHTKIQGKNGFYQVNNFFINLMLVNPSCGFVALGDTQYRIKCEHPHCEIVQLAQNVQYMGGREGDTKIQISMPVGQNTKQQTDFHERHTNPFAGCDSDYVIPPPSGQTSQPKPGCLRIKPLK